MSVFQLPRKRRTKVEALAWLRERVDPKGREALERLIDRNGVEQTAQDMARLARSMKGLKPVKGMPRTITKVELQQLIVDLEKPDEETRD